jgi:hypothetical protein
MSFDTDYLNSQKEKLNESKSNVICFDLPIVVLLRKVKRAVASKLSKNFSLFFLPKGKSARETVSDKIMNL